MTIRPITILACAVALSTSACFDDEAISDIELRHIYFDGDEVQQALAEDPDTVFFADLRVGNIVHFDKSSGDFDFDNFLVQCPSMATPIPMDYFVEVMNLDVADYTSWTVQSAETPKSDGFRAPDQVCDDDDDGDCIIIGDIIYY